MVTGSNSRTVSESKGIPYIFPFGAKTEDTHFRGPKILGFPGIPKILKSIWDIDWILYLAIISLVGSISNIESALNGK